MTIEKDSRAALAMFLPDALLAAILSYKNFSESEIPQDAKGFSAHHSACKVAIAHIELLIKLARRLIEEGQNDKDLAADLARVQDMIDQAHAELSLSGFVHLDEDDKDGDNDDDDS